MRLGGEHWSSMAYGVGMGVVLGGLVFLGIAGYRHRDEWLPWKRQRVAKQEVFPGRVDLWVAADRQSLVVQATLEKIGRAHV